MQIRIRWRGWLWLLAYFYPVYYTQDIDLKNNGYDILTLKPTKKSYFRGTHKQLKKACL